jgi:hypothetical protein
LKLDPFIDLAMPFTCRQELMDGEADTGS